MESAIITGTGIYNIPGFEWERKVVETEYGPALVNIGRQGDFELAFLARHGLDHTTPPHKINFLANIKALKMLGVKRIIATNAVGSINRDIPPMGVSLITDFIDFTSNRHSTFFSGGKSGLAHTNMDEAYCPTLGAKLLEYGPRFNLNIYPQSVYVVSNGPRFETPAEIRAFERLGGDIVGMTGVPEVVLAHELGMHYAAIAYSINWAAGIEKKMVFYEDRMTDVRNNITSLLVHTLRERSPLTCSCETACMVMHAPEP